MLGEGILRTCHALSREASREPCRVLRSQAAIITSTRVATIARINGGKWAATGINSARMAIPAKCERGALPTIVHLKSMLPTKKIAVLPRTAIAVFVSVCPSGWASTNSSATAENHSRHDK